MNTLTGRLIEVRSQMKSTLVDICKQGRPFKSFPLGQLAWTAGLNDLMAEDEGLAQFVFVALRRHSNHDWGDCCEEDRKANDWSWQHDGRILSVYKTDKVPDGKIWIITEWDRSVTTILLPSEY